MANLTEKSNGTYQIRIFCGRDEKGRQISRSCIFKPSKSNLSYSKLTKEPNDCVKRFEEQVKAEMETGALAGCKKPSKMLFEQFCEEYLKIKQGALSPNTYSFYCRSIDNHLIPLYGKMKLEDFRIYHIQNYIQYVSDMERRDRYDGKVAPSTVKRYVSVFRSILALTYGRRRTSVNFGFIFANLCKLFMQKWSVLHFGTDHLGNLIFSPSLFFDYSDAIIAF